MTTIACVCPPMAGGRTRHPDGDTVTLRERLGFRAALAVKNSIVMGKQEDPDMGAGEVLAIITEQYLLGGIESWSLVDAKGKKVEPDRESIRAFMADHPMEAMEVGDAADAIYHEAVMLPLIQRASRSSQPTQTDSKTSATNGSAPTPLKPSKQSSTSTTQTDDTARMSA